MDLQNDLIILLYCLNNSLGSVTRSRIAFALPFAVHLAEAGRNGVEKGLGNFIITTLTPPSNLTMSHRVHVLFASHATGT